jgi:tetratricopeptide (TPR) repeat protein
MGWFATQTPLATGNTKAFGCDPTRCSSYEFGVATSYERVANQIYERMSSCTSIETDLDDLSRNGIDITGTDEDSILQENGIADDDMSLWSGYQSHNLSFENDKETYSMIDILAFPHPSSQKMTHYDKFSASEDIVIEERNISGRNEPSSRAKTSALSQRLLNLGESHARKKECASAQECYAKAICLFAVKLGADSPEAIDATVKSGCVYLASNNSDGALQMFQTARNLQQNQYGKEADLQVAYLSEQISLIQKEKKQYAASLKQMKLALRLYKAHHGELHTTVARCAAEIASLYKLMDERDKAMAVYTQVLKIQVGLYGKLHPVVADTLFELALLHDELGQHDKSMKITKKAYLIFNATVGENTLAVTRVLSHFGNLYCKLDRKNKAFKAYGRTLHIRKSLLGRNHELVADTLMDIGSLLRTQGQHQQSMQCMMEALDIYKKCHGEKTVAVSDVMNIIGMAYYDQGDCDNAIQVYTQVLNIRVNELGENHHAVANVLNNIGTVYSKKKDYENALRSYNTSLRLYEKHEQRDHLKYAVTLVNIGTVMKGTGDYVKAEEAFRNALDICYEDVILGQDHPVVMKAKKGLLAINARAYSGHFDSFKQ